MKHIISLLTGTLCAFTFFISAEESAAVEVVEAGIPVVEEAVALEDSMAKATETTSDAVIAAVPNVAEALEEPTPAHISTEVVASEESQPEVVTTQPTVQKVKAANKKDSWWDKILKLFKISDDQTRTCEQALAKMMKEKTVSIDFSNTSNFAENGDSSMTTYYKTLVSTKAFGTHSPNLYLNLSKTNVSKEFVTKWAAEFKKTKKIILWNLSENNTIDDSILDAIYLPLTYSLNLSNTLVTDAAIAKIISTLETTGIGYLVCVNLSGSKVTDGGVASLKTALQTAVNAWKTKNPGKEYNLEGADESGVIFEKLPIFPKTKKAKDPKPNLTLNSGDVNAQVAPTPAEIPTIEGSNLQQEPIAEASLVVEQPVVESAPVTDQQPAEAPGDLTSVEGQAKEALNDVDAIISSTLPTANQVIEDPITVAETSGIDGTDQSTEPTEPATDVIIG